MSLHQGEFPGSVSPLEGEGRTRTDFGARRYVLRQHMGRGRRHAEGFTLARYSPLAFACRMRPRSRVDVTLDSADIRSDTLDARPK